MSNAFTRSPLLGHLLQDSDVAAAFSEQAFAAKLIAFEQAWSEALIHTGTVSAADGSAALDAIAACDLDMAAIERASETDGLPLPEIVRQLRAGQPSRVQGAIHTGATSQDVIDTATVLTCLDIFAMFKTRLETVLAQLGKLDASFGARAMMGRTRMQAALPITVRDRIRIWQEPLGAHLSALETLTKTIAVLQCGGPVGLRDAPSGQGDAVAAHVAKTLGLTLGPVWHTDRSAMLDMGHWLTKLSGSLGKIGQDIALMAQQGLDEITLDGAGGSSAMPHKQNPIRAEILVAIARSVAGQQSILAQTLIHEQERSGAAWTLEWMTLPSMFEASGAALNNAEVLLAQIKDLGSREGL